jgi:hypothetical protein
MVNWLPLTVIRTVTGSALWAALKAQPEITELLRTVTAPEGGAMTMVPVRRR